MSQTGATYRRTEQFRGARFETCDLSGASATGSDLRGVTVRGSWVDGMRLVGCVIGELQVSSFAGDPARVLVDDVDVSQFVSDTLDQRHPERVQLRAVATAADHRAMWSTVERLWGELLARGEALPDAVRRERVAGEWSLTETVRHLVFAVDCWLGRMLRGEEHPFHPFGLPPSDFPVEQLASIGLDPAADPPYAAAREVLAGRQAAVREQLSGLSDAELTEQRTIAIAPPVWGEETETVGQCFRVLHHEHVEHHRYALRDLATLTG